MHGTAPGPRVLAGKYCLADRLAQGGMGTVWRAEHLQLHMPVAVKLMSPKMVGSGAARARFEREALAAAQLRSRHVVTIHDYGFDGEEPFIVMELLDGEDLATRLRRVKKLAPDATAVIVGQIARALERAHAAGLVHRDLKPANVFIARVDDEDVVKVLDFGIAKAFGEETPDGVTGDDEVLGTPYFMSPEQIRKSGPLDPRVDVWALGVIAYRMLTGALPWTGDTRGDIVVRVCTDPFPRPSTLEPSLGPAVDHFFDRALAKAPEDRFGSARELVAALDAALGTGIALGSSQRVSLHDISAAMIAPFGGAAYASSATFTPLPNTHALIGAALREGDNTLSAPSGYVHPAPPEGSPSRRRTVVAAIAITALSALVGVTVGLGLLRARNGAPSSPTASTERPSTAAAPPTALPVSSSAAPSPADAPTPAPEAPASAAPTASAAASPSSSASATPAVKPGPTKRRKVVLGL